MPRINSAHCMAQDESSGSEGLIFIMPRGIDRLALGGLVEPGEWCTDVGLENYAPIRDMVARCQDFLPVLRNATLVSDLTVQVALRPARPNGIRLEHQCGTRIVHNVGHGGSGATVSWGCAEEVIHLLARLEIS
jgi:D-amino-acid oxidase